jgi:hypothetical protein
MLQQIANPVCLDAEAAQFDQQAGFGGRPT